MRTIYFRLFIYTIILLILPTITGCEDFQLGNDFLEKRESTDLTKDEVFSSKIYAEQALSEVYRTLPDLLPGRDRLNWCSLDTYTDLGDYRKTSNIPVQYSGSYDATTGGQSMLYRMDTGQDNRGPWVGIRSGYIYMENVDQVTDMTEREKEIRKGEVKTIIAYHYTQMMRYYGGVPWVNKSFAPDDDFQTERLTIEAMVDSVVSLLDQAAEVLPWSVSQSDDGRMTKASALALKTRILLFAASPLFNSNEPYAQGEAADKGYVWYGNYDINRWKRALDSGLEFIEEQNKNGVYKLVNTGNPREDYQAGYFNRNNGEILISSRWRATYDRGQFFMSQLAYGVCNPTLNLVDMFPMADGSDFDWSNPEHAQYPFFKDGVPTRDVRLYETCIVNEDDFQNRKAETYVGGREYNRSMLAKSGFGFRKFFQDQNSVYGKPYQSPLLRLPEVYLSIAEAYNELGQSDQAYEYINKVRNRVGLPGLVTGHSQSELRDEILLERVREFAFEEVRYFDLVRFKRHDIFKSTANVKILQINKISDRFTYEIQTSPTPRLAAEHWDAKYLLLPIPQNEINKKYGLVQNPGW